MTNKLQCNPTLIPQVQPRPASRPISFHSYVQIRWDKCSPKLAKASADARRHVEVSPSRYGLHWTELDEDSAITPLLRDAEVMDKELSTNPEFLALIERARAQQQAEGGISSAEMRRRWGTKK